jgi:hypothetical protein
MRTCDSSRGNDGKLITHTSSAATGSTRADTPESFSMLRVQHFPHGSTGLVVGRSE